jgi:hypothetical protein
MRDTVRLFISFFILFFLVTASASMAFALASTFDQSLNSQYPKGAVLNLLSTGVVGTIGCNGGHPTSTFKLKDGKLHAPGLLDTVTLTTMKCDLYPIAAGTKVYLADARVYLKNNRVAFALVQCEDMDKERAVSEDGSVADCPNGNVSQVDFEFPKGSLATAGFAQFQDAVSHVFSVVSRPNSPAQAVQGGAPVGEPAPPAEETSIDPGVRNGGVSEQARPVLDRAVQFLGGVDNIRARRDDEGRMHETMVSPKGNIEIDVHWVMVYPGITWQDYKISFGAKSMSGESFFDGTIGWQINDGKLTDMNEDQKRNSRHNVFDEFPNLLGLIGGPTVTYEGKSGGDDILLFRQENLSVRLHIDSTGKIIKKTYHGKTGDFEESLSDYREVRGIKTAYRISVTKNGQRFLDAEIIEASANAKPNLETLAQKPGGQTLSASYLASIAPLECPSLYVSTQSPTDHLLLNADRSFMLQEGGQPYHGTFAIRGNTLLLNISESNIQTSLTRQGHDLADSSGQTWSHREQSAGAVASGAVLKNADIIKLAKVGIDDATITAKIKSSRCQFDTSTDALVLLKKSGVSAAVLKAMVGAQQ